jgi:hypothetical protein
MKTYYKDFTGVTASINEKKDGTAKLIIALPSGKRVLSKEYKSKQSAYSAWKRYCD